MPSSLVRRASALRAGRALRSLLGCPVIPVGSFRRGAALAKDCDFVCVAPRSPFHLLSHRNNVSVVHGGRRHCQARVNGVSVDLFWARPAEEPWALFHWSGPRSYNIRVRALARRRGLRLNQYGLFHRDTGRRVRGTRSARTERDVCRILGVTYRSPARRQ